MGGRRTYCFQRERARKWHARPVRAVQIIRTNQYNTADLNELYRNKVTKGTRKEQMCSYVEFRSYSGRCLSRHFFRSRRTKYQRQIFRECKDLRVLFESSGKDLRNNRIKTSKRTSREDDVAHSTFDKRKLNIEGIIEVYSYKYRSLQQLLFLLSCHRLSSYRRNASGD